MLLEIKRFCLPISSLLNPCPEWNLLSQLGLCALVQIVKWSPLKTPSKICFAIKPKQPKTKQTKIKKKIKIPTQPTSQPHAHSLICFRVWSLRKLYLHRVINIQYNCRVVWIARCRYESALALLIEKLYHVPQYVCWKIPLPERISSALRL